MPQRHPVTSLVAIPPGTGQTFTVAGQRIACFNVGGQIHAMDDVCPHAGASLAEGKLTGCVVTCPWHAIDFDVTNGSPVRQRGMEPQKTFPVFINGDQIEVEA